MKNNILPYLASTSSYANLNPLLKKIEEGDQESLNNVIKDLKNIFSGQYSPLAHVLAMKLTKQLFLLSKQEIILKIQTDLLSQIAKIAMYRTEGKIDKGSTYFSTYPQYIKGDQKIKQNIKKLGHQYIIYSLESIKTWADWIPFNKQGSRSQFSNTYQILKKKNIQFPNEKYFYKDVDKERFDKVYKMEFFNTESSFEQSVLNDENFQNVATRQLFQIDQVLNNIKSQLQPKESQTNWRRVKHYIQSCQIFYYEQSVQIIRQLKNLANQNSSYRENIQKILHNVIEKQSYVAGILSDYKLYVNKKFSYEDFFLKYGNSREAFFKSKKSENHSNSYYIEPQQIHISNQNQKSSKKRALNTGYNKQSIKRPGSAMNHQADRQKQNFKEIQNLKKKFEQQKQKYQTRIREQQTKADLRVNEVKKMINISNSKDQDQLFKRLQQQKYTYKNQYEQLKTKNQIQEQNILQFKKEISRYNQEIKDYRRIISEKQNQYQRLKQQCDRLRNINMEQDQIIFKLKNTTVMSPNQLLQSPSPYAEQKVNKFLGEEQFDKKSIKSKNSNINKNETLLKKLEKQIQNLIDQKQLISNQLEIERNKSHKIYEFEMNTTKEEMIKIKQKLIEKQEIEKNLILKLDFMEVQKMKVEQNIKIKNNIIESLKKQNEWMSKALNSNNNLNELKRNEEIHSKKKVKQIQKQKQKLIIRYYLDNNIEGDTYYQEFNKQFKIRYRRSCLKKKQLLYKQSHMEIGIISELRAIDLLNIAIFLTNYGLKDIKDVKFKILNPSINQIHSEANQFDLILQGEQQKFYIDIKIHSYPIGPVILKLSYLDEDKERNIQILLPVNIFKFMTHQNRKQQLKESSIIKFKYDHKMIKDDKSLKQYLSDIEFIQQKDNLVGKIVVTHNHSKTTFWMDIIKSIESVDVKYKLIQGWDEIMDYYIKNMRHLLEK